MSRTTVTLSLLILAATFAGRASAVAQEGPAERFFAAGLTSFRAGDYDLAATAFVSASEVRGRNPLSPASHIMAAKS